MDHKEDQPALEAHLDNSKDLTGQVPCVRTAQDPVQDPDQDQDNLFVEPVHQVIDPPSI